MTKPQEEQIRLLRNQVNWVIHDSLSFLWLKNGRYHGMIPTICGGGNLMMANSALSALNYLGKVNSFLNYGRKKGAEDGVFKELVKDLYVSGLSLGVDVDDAKEIWRRFRIGLSHMNYPKGAILTHAGLADEKTIFKGNEAVAEAIENLQDRSFTKMFEASGSGEYIYTFNVEIFIFRDLAKIREFLVKKINATSLDKIEKLAKWEEKARINTPFPSLTHK